MEPIRFTVPACPVPQPRQRHRVVTTGDGRAFAQNYTSRTDPVQAFKATVRMAAQAAYQGGPLDGPVRVVATFILPRPKYLTWKRKPMPRQHSAARPDLDNLAKSLKDALTGLLWVDDIQVSVMSLEKWYAAGDEQPCVVVEVGRLEG